MQINVNYGSSVNNAPTGFKQDVNAVVNFFENTFTSGITLTLDVGYGEIDGKALASGDLGESLRNQSLFETYSTVANALKAATPYAADLPATDPTNGGSVRVSTAEAEALGISPVSGVLDGWVGFSNQSGIFDYSQSGTPPTGQYGFMGVVEHELTEIMGRVAAVNQTVAGSSNPLWTPLDLYRYTAPGVDSGTETSSQVSYFSTDGGQTNLATFNNGTSNGGDSGDWASSVSNDAFRAFTSSGSANPMSSVDTTEMQALGYSTAAADYTITDTYDSSNNLTSEKIAMNSGGNVVVNYLAGSTQVEVTSINGTDTHTYTMAANAQIVFGEDTTVSAGSATNQIVIGGTSASVDGGSGSGGNLLIALGVGVQLTQGASDTSAIALANAYATVNAGKGNIWVGSGLEETINASGDAITLDGNTQVTVIGGGNTITDTSANNKITLSSTNGVADTLAAIDDTITLSASTQANISGSGNNVTATGSGSTATFSNDNGVRNTFTGSNDTIKLAGSTYVYISGGGNTVIDAGISDTVDLANTNGSADAFTGGNDNVELDGNVQANFSGSGISVQADGSNNSVVFSSTYGSSDNFTGSNDFVTLSGNAHVSVDGGGNTITASGTGNLVNMSGTNGAVDTFTGSNTSVWMGPSTQAVVYGGGNAIHTAGLTALTTFDVTTSASFLANQQELYRIYQAVLGRAPDADGFQYWVNQLQNGTSDASIVAGFMGSSEFQAKYGSLDNTGFVTALYQNVLGRQPDSSGLQYWVNALNNGLGRPQLVLNFANSSEFESSSAAAVQAYITGSRFASLSATSTQQFGDIYRLYTAGLGRSPDASGLYYWAHEIQNGTPESTIAQGFVNSSEFQQLYPTSESNTQFVTQLYQNILGRQPDSSGLQYWVNALNGGMSRAALLTTLADSSEYQNDTAAAETEFMNGALYGYWQT